MRKWIVAAAALLLLCIAALVAVLNLNSFIKHNKDYLVAKAEQALGRKVSVGDAEVTIFDGIGVRLMDVALSDDPPLLPATLCAPRISKSTSSYGRSSGKSSRLKG